MLESRYGLCLIDFSTLHSYRVERYVFISPIRLYNVSRAGTEVGQIAKPVLISWISCRRFSIGKMFRLNITVYGNIFYAGCPSETRTKRWWSSTPLSGGLVGTVKFIGLGGSGCWSCRKICSRCCADRRCSLFLRFRVWRRGAGCAFDMMFKVT